jgi:hypothetical protein
MLDFHPIARLDLAPKGHWLPRMDYDNPGRPAGELDPYDDGDDSGMDGNWNNEEDEDDAVPPRGRRQRSSDDLPARLVPFHWIHK